MQDSISIYPTVDSAAQVIRMADNRLQIRTPTERVTIGRHADLAMDLLGLCDGTRRLEDILSRLVTAGRPEQQVRELFAFLTRKAVLANGAQGFEDSLMAHARHYGKRVSGGESSTERLSPDQPVAVCGKGKLAEAVRADLTYLGISQIQPSDAGHATAALCVTCSDYDGHASFRERNRAAVTDRQPILFACIAETNIRIGPFVMPGETACFECFHHRLRANLSYREEFDAFLAYEAALEKSGAESRAQLYARLASVFVCAQVANYLFGSLHYCAFDRVIELCPITAELTSGRVLKLPRCTVCGRVEESPSLAPRDWV